MKKNIVIGILSILVVGLGGAFVYMNIQDKEKDIKKPDKIDTSIDDTKKDPVNNNKDVEETKKEYIHFTSTELKMDKNSSTGSGIQVEIKNGKLVETSNKGLKFSGIDGDVKYFTYDIADGGGIGFLVLTEDYKVYAATVYVDVSAIIGNTGIVDKNVIFEQVNISDKVVDITEYVYPHTFVTSDGIYLGVVLENGKIYAIEGYLGNQGYSLGKRDYSIYKKLYLGMIVYSSNEVALDHNEDKKIQYDKRTIIAKKILYKGGYNEGFTYYIQDKNDLLYKVETEFETDVRYDSKVKKVSLMNNEVVLSIEKQDDSHVIVTYKDNTTDILEVSLEDGICDID